MHWADKILEIFDADTTDLRKLAIIAGVDPRYFYVGTDLEGADIRGQDLRGMLLTNLDLSKVIYDRATQIDVDTDTDFLDEIKKLEIKKDVVVLTKLGAQEERLVCLLKLYIENPGYEKFIDGFVSERSEFSAKSISNFRQVYRRDLFGETISKPQFYRFIDVMINMSFPKNRAKLIFNLAKHLGYDKNVVQLLNKRLVPNATMSPYLGKIEEMLAEWKSKR